MADNDDFNHLVRRTAAFTLAFFAGLVFGIILLTSGDYIPGAIIVVATLAGLATQIPIIHKLYSEGPGPSPPRGKPTS